MALRKKLAALALIASIGGVVPQAIFAPAHADGGYLVLPGIWNGQTGRWVIFYESGNHYFIPD